MKEIKIIIILSLILCLSCKNKIADTNSQEKISTTSISDENTKNKIEIKDYTNTQSFKNCNETFEDFFKQFGQDSIFQKNRIKYPLQYSVSDYDYSSNKDTLGIELIQRKNYNYLDFTVDKDAINNEYDKYTFEIKKVNDTITHYEHLGYDNGIQVSYKFKLIDGCWYMVEILDEST